MRDFITVALIAKSNVKLGQYLEHYVFDDGRVLEPAS